MRRKMSDLVASIILLILGVAGCLFGVSIFFSAAPTVPTCNSVQMTHDEVCDRTSDGQTTTYDYDQKLQFDIQEHNKNGWYLLGGGAFFIIIGGVGLIRENSRRRKAVGLIQ